MRSIPNIRPYNCNCNRNRNPAPMTLVDVFMNIFYVKHSLPTKYRLASDEVPPRGR